MQPSNAAKFHPSLVKLFNGGNFGKLVLQVANL